MAVDSTIKRKTASGYEEIHPKTKAAQVEGLATTISTAIASLNNIGDVNVSGVTDGQALIYDDATDSWIPGTASGGGGGGSSGGLRLVTTLGTNTTAESLYNQIEAFVPGNNESHFEGCFFQVQASSIVITGGADATHGLFHTFSLGPITGVGEEGDDLFDTVTLEKGDWIVANRVWTINNADQFHWIIVNNNDASKVSKAGDTMTGDLNVKGDGSGRARIKLVSTANQPNDLYFGANNVEYWSLTSRDNTQPFLGLYNASGLPGWAWQISNSTNVMDFLFNPTVNGTAVSLAGHTHTFASLTSKPTTLSGYGITDAYSSSNPSGYQTAAQVASSISALVDSAPGTLNTLNELAAALGDDPNFATTVTNSIAGKLGISAKAADSNLLDGIDSTGFWRQSGSWLGDLGSNGYTREAGLSMTGGSEFVVLSKNGQGSLLVDGHYMSYEPQNGFFGSSTSAYGDLTGIQATAANTLTVKQLDGNNADLQVTGNITGRAVAGQYSDIYRIGGIYFGWSNDVYGVQTNHSIRSTYGDTYGDNITMNSYNHIRFNLDSNNNNAGSVFEVGRDTTGTGNVLFQVNDSGNMLFTGTLTQGTVPWARLSGVPSTFAPSSHTHDDRYYTESEADGRFINTAGDTMTGLLVGRANNTGGIAVASQGLSSLEAYSTGNAAAYMTFHKAGHYAVRLGLDTDNQLKVGGWSMGAVAYTIWHSGNFNPGSYLTTSGKAADSELLDGIDSSRVVFGDGSRGKSKSLQNGNANTSDATNASGFYFGTNVTGMPSTDWWNWMTVAGNSWSGGDGYAYQLANSFWSDDLRIRRMTSGSWSGWNRVYTDAYRPYADSAGNANTVDGYNIVVGSTGSDASTLYFVT
jgi:hypothetical protein